MALLSATDQQALRAAFAPMTRPVTILFFTQAIGCETCDETQQILREITDLTPQVTVEEVNLVLEGERAASYGIDRAPGLVLLAGDEKEDTRIRMLGAPAGYDFMSLIDAILLKGVEMSRGELMVDRGTGAVNELHKSKAGRIYVHAVTQLEISSTELRQIIDAGRDPRFLVPDPVRDIILESGCYARNR